MAGEEWGHDRVKAGIDTEELGGPIGEHMRNFFGIQTPVDGEQNCPQLRCSRIEVDIFQAVLGKDRYTVSLFDTVCDESRGQSLDPIDEFAVCHALAFTHERCSVPVNTGVTSQYVVYRVIVKAHPHLLQVVM